MTSLPRSIRYAQFIASMFQLSVRHVFSCVACTGSMVCSQPKVQLYSSYERVKDCRSFGERRVEFKGLTILEEVVPGAAPSGFAFGAAAPAEGDEAAAAPAADAPPAN